MLAFHRWLLTSLGLAALADASACDLDRPLRHVLRNASLLRVAEALADSSGCRVVLSTELQAQSRQVDWSARSSVAEALDRIAVAHELNWRSGDDGSIELGPRGAPPPQSHQSGALVIEADGSRAQGAVNLVDQGRLPSESSPAIPRTRIGEQRVDDDAMHDYATAIMRAPSLYTMATGDGIRGVSSGRLMPSQRASLLTIDGVPMPSEVWLFNRPGLGLMRSLDITRTGTGLASAFGAGAGDIAIGTRAPAAQFGGEVLLSDAPQLAPRAGLTMTGSLGVPGLVTSFSSGRQLEAETYRGEAQPDIERQRQTSARFEWRDPAQRHLLQGSFLDIAQRDLGGAWISTTCGQPVCPAGGDVAVSGGALGWHWQAAPAVRLVANLGLSDAHSRISQYAGALGLRTGQPALLRTRHADLRADADLDDTWSISAGIAQARRERITFSRSNFDIPEQGSTSLGIAPLEPGTATLAYTVASTRLTDLPQAYAEMRADDGQRWDGHLGLRYVLSESASLAAARDISESNCRALPDHHPPGITTCSDVASARVTSNNAGNRVRRDLALPSFGLRYRFGARHWLALAARESFVASDLLARALSPAGAMERLRVVELAWHREFARGTELEARLFRQGWRDRNANLSIPGVPFAQEFSSDISGAELTLSWQPSDRVELWSQASTLRGGSDLVLAAGEEVRLNGAPSRSYGVGGRLHFDWGGYLGGHYSHAAEAWFINSSGRFDRLPARDLLDARFGFRHGRYDLSLWGTNLLDDDYVIETFGMGANSANTPYHAYDRIVGVDLRVGF